MVIYLTSVAVPSIFDKCLVRKLPNIAWLLIESSPGLLIIECIDYMFCLKTDRAKASYQGIIYLHYAKASNQIYWEVNRFMSLVCK